MGAGGACGMRAVETGGGSVPSREVDPGSDPSAQLPHVRVPDPDGHGVGKKPLCASVGAPCCKAQSPRGEQGWSPASPRARAGAPRAGALRPLHAHVASVRVLRGFSPPVSPSGARRLRRLTLLLLRRWQFAAVLEPMTGDSQRQSPGSSPLRRRLVFFPQVSSPSKQFPAQEIQFFTSNSETVEAGMRGLHL